MTHKPTTTTAAADDDDDDVEGTGGSMGGWMAEWPRDKRGGAGLETTMMRLPPDDAADVNGKILNARCSRS